MIFGYYSVQQKNHGRSIQTQAIVNMPPCIICQLQSMNGKSNFLKRFIINYANIMKGFMHLLKQDTPFIWDEVA